MMNSREYMINRNLKIKNPRKYPRCVSCKCLIVQSKKRNEFSIKGKPIFCSIGCAAVYGMDSYKKRNPIVDQMCELMSEFSPKEEIQSCNSECQGECVDITNPEHISLV
jgi:hypothetical protein